MKTIFISVLLFSTAVSASPITILGIPLGGKIGYPIKICAHNFPPTPVACWIEKPFRGKTGSVGTAMLPNASLPEWAVYKSASLNFSKDDTFTSISIGNLELSSEGVIRNSIEKRFGSPRTLSRHPSGSITQWTHPDVEVEMICSAASTCQVSFVSSSEHSVREAMKSAYEKERIARPVSP